MFCHGCGRAIQAEYRYCAHCGAQLPLAVAGSGGTVREPSRMQVHVKVLAVAYIVYNLIGLVASIGLLAAMTAAGAFLGSILGAGPEMQGLIRALIGSLGMLFVLESVAGLFAGFGLLQYYSWARTLTIILSLINLLHIPFGTVLGLYGLWVLISAEGERHYQQMALATG